MDAALTVASLAGPALLRALAATWRFREIAEDGTVGEATHVAADAVYALWHAHLLPHAVLHRNEDLAVLVSRHRDGEIIARILDRLGYLAVRGSSSRGGSPGLLEMIRAARSGRPLAFTPDGPRGPPRVCKPGVVHAAAASGLPLIPIAAAATRAWHLRSWDRFLLPRPGATVYVSYGRPLLISPDTRKEQVAEWQRRIAVALNAVAARCEAAAGASRAARR